MGAAHAAEAAEAVVVAAAGAAAVAEAAMAAMVAAAVRLTAAPRALPIRRRRGLVATPAIERTAEPAAAPPPVREAERAHASPGQQTSASRC